MKIEKNTQGLIKILFVFMIFMLLFTFLSRASKSITTPKVQTTELSEMLLNDEMTVTGVVKKSRVLPIFVLENQKVKELRVHLGQKIKKDTPLFSVDMDYLAQQIAEKERELKKQTVQEEAEANSSANQKKLQALKITQAQESYNQSVQSAEKRVTAAQEELTQAENALKKEAKSEELKQMVAEKKKMLETAREEQSTTLIQAKQTLELAQSETLETSGSGDLAKLEQESIRETLKKLKELHVEKGVVKAKIEGIVSKINLLSGALTSVEAPILVEDTTSNSVLEVDLTKDQLSYFSIGQAGEVEGVSESGASVLSKESVVSEVKSDPQNPEMMKAVISLGEGDFQYQSQGVLTIEKSSQKYPYCLPITALKGTEGGYFVLTLEKRKTALSTENVARKQSVKILAKNETTVAIQKNDLLEGSKIILELNKSISDGDVVRVQEVSENEE
ncbi:hypothetical protein SAMN02745116_02362 [Pilibacter termitis]|uniref:HlyD family secretion protein n=1 Tax=Pilibacter termitis TaxID=263852 RepID=A0A1T4QXL7_9ENTE|nr:hypothetical protein [Pilibacter termitis]SKA08500.1 hypothetical protein SAMN02745116_02362 [Pilibacter termitis]